MIVKQPIPTIPFDATKHVVQGRTKLQGEHVFFDLESIIAAEHRIEVVTPVPAPVPVPAPQPAAPVCAPAAELPPEAKQAISELLAARVALKAENDALTARVAKLESDNAVFTANFATFKAMTGAGT